MKLKICILLFISIFKAPAFAQKTSFFEISADHPSLLYQDGQRATFLIHVLTRPTNPDFKITFVANYPNETTPISLDVMGELYLFTTPVLAEFTNPEITITAYIASGGAKFSVQSEKRILNVSSPIYNAVIGSGGGTVSAAGLATVQFAAGAFSSNAGVSVYANKTLETAVDFNTSNSILSTDSRSDFEIRVNTGMQLPTNDVQMVMNIPTRYIRSLQSGSQIQGYVQIMEDSGDEVIDSFELADSSFDSANDTLHIAVPAAAFTNLRTDDGSYEAIILSASVSSSNRIMGKRSRRRSMGLVGSCLANPIGSPLTGPTPPPVNLGGAYNPPGHRGVDLQAVDVPIYAVADGIITSVGFDKQDLKKPDPRSGKLVKGWGQYVVVKHAVDGAYTLYGHLTKGSTLDVGTKVIQGQQIAVSDNSGGSSGPHLHLEYAPSANASIKKSTKIDPYPCIMGAQFSISASQLSFQIPNVGTNPPSQTIFLDNIGSRAITPIVAVSPSAPWLTVLFEGKNVGIGDSMNVIVSVNSVLLPASGNASAIVTILDSKDQKISQSFQVQVSRAQQSIIVVNGSFESDSFSLPYQLRPALTGWRNIIGYDNAGLPYGISNSYSQWGPTPYGNQYIAVGFDFDSYQYGIEQTISGFSVGQEYTVSFAGSSSSIFQPSLLGVTINDTSQTFVIPYVYKHPYDKWNTYAKNFTANSTTTTLSFKGYSSSGGFIGIDNVSIALATPGPTTTPVPSPTPPCSVAGTWDSLATRLVLNLQNSSATVKCGGCTVTVPLVSSADGKITIKGFGSSVCSGNYLDWTLYFDGCSTLVGSFGSIICGSGGTLGGPEKLLREGAYSPTQLYLDNN